MRFIDLDALLQKRDRWGQADELWTNATLKQDFRNWFYNKCWYTESTLAGHDAIIDHFRPKAAVKCFEKYEYNKPLEKCGYFWLKNDPRNYRVSCTYANRVTGTGEIQGGKGTYFPLCPDSPRLTENGIEKEKPLLLDPCNHDDVYLLSFMGCKAVPASVDGLEKQRADASIKIYNLKNPYIEAERAKVWNEVEQTLCEYNVGEISRTACIRRLEEATSRKAPYSACAIACINALAPDELKADLDLIL